MDEILDVVGVIAELGLEGVFTWILRIVGIVVFLGGTGLWLFTDMGLLVVPAVLMGGGIVLVVVPSLLLAVAELA